MAYIEFKNVVKEYIVGENSIKALDNANFEIEKGELVVIVGPSGAGKTTALNVLGGMDNVTSGEVIIDGQRVDKYSEKELTHYRREDIGFVFQFYNLVQNLTALENVELATQICKKPLNPKTTIEKVGLKEHAHKKPNQLSGGQMQRVAIARALVKNPKVLFCDEPTGALDEKTGKNVLSLLQKINKKYHTTMIIVTHNPSIANMGNTVIKMNSGNIVETIKNKEIIDAKDLGWA